MIKSRLKRKILRTVIIEDNNFYNKLITNQIYASNEKFKIEFNCKFDVRSYVSPEDFLRNIQSDTDIAFVDYYLDSPINGLDVLKSIKSHCPNCRVIIVSQSMSKKVSIESYENGAYEYILKDSQALSKIRDIMEDTVHDFLNNKNGGKGFNPFVQN